MVASNLTLKVELISGKKKFIGEEIEIVERLDDSSFQNITFLQCELSNGTFERSLLKEFSFNTSTGINLNFSNVVFEFSFATNYLFEKTNFSGVNIKDSDFSGGAFDKVDFSNAKFESSDFTLCDFQNVSFQGATFINCNFNASNFEKCDFRETSFINSTFNYIEGMSVSILNEIKANGAIASFPIPIMLKTMISDFFRHHKIIGNITLLILVFMLGMYAKPVCKKTVRLLYLDANPLNQPIKQLTIDNTPSYFYTQINLSNYDFSEEFEHWKVIGNKDVNDNHFIKIDKQEFSSFPSSLCIKNFAGQVFYITNKQKTFFNQDALLEKLIWMNVASKGEKLKFSYFYKYGHPKFSIYGKLKDGGYTIISEVEQQINSKNPNWIYYSEEVIIENNCTAVCLKLSEFPEHKIYIDDVNIETAF